MTKDADLTLRYVYLENKAKEAMYCIPRMIDKGYVNGNDPSKSDDSI